MSSTANKFPPDVRERAVWMEFDHESEYPSRWAAISSIANMIAFIDDYRGAFGRWGNSPPLIKWDLVRL